jgi:nickel-dependent lactate racemase
MVAPLQTRLAYGKQGLALALDPGWDVTIVEPRFVPGLADPAAALAAALQHPTGCSPLGGLVRPGDRVGIIFNDITRATPNPLLIQAVLQELRHIPASDITLFDALGTHRPNTEAELRSLIGNDLVDSFRIVQNNAFDPTTQVHLGTTRRGHEIRINRDLVECDLKILTGFIEPHFFAGFSGAGKAVMPGMAGLPTILGNHDASMIGSPTATWGITHGNPIWEEIQEIAHKVGKTFLLNVTLNRDKAITGIFAGDLDLAHAAGCDFVRQTVMAPVERPFEVVVTSNSGYPLDLNLYQTVKGMSAAAQVVQNGGAIIIASECWDGIPEHGLYGRLLREAGSPQALLAQIQSPGFLKQDQWQAQIQAQVQLKADVYVYSDHLSPEQIRAALLKPAPSIADLIQTLIGRYGPQARICILPEGPVTIPYIAPLAVGF